MIVLPALSSVNNILDTDLVLVEHSNGEGFKMTGADLKNLIKAQAVDTVALNNMQPATSNAVYNALLKEESDTYTDTHKNGSFDFIKIGKIVYFQTTGDWLDMPQGYLPLFTLPAKYRPRKQICLREGSASEISIFIETDGTLRAYNYGSSFVSVTNGYYICSWVSV